MGEPGIVVTPVPLTIALWGTISKGNIEKGPTDAGGAAVPRSVNVTAAKADVLAPKSATNETTIDNILTALLIKCLLLNEIYPMSPKRLNAASI